MTCQNSYDSSRDLSGIVSCHDHPREVRVTIEYNDLDSDIWELCSECAERLIDDAQGRGYHIEREPIGGSS
jgi:hypothetical protein